VATLSGVHDSLRVIYSRFGERRCPRCDQPLEAAGRCGGCGFRGITGGLLYAIAWCQAVSTVYTITTARVVMRIGAALTMTLQIPYRWIGAADLDLRRDGTGSIALNTVGETTFSYVMVWPHVRPWRFPTRPSLRCIPHAENVAQMLGQAAQARPMTVTQDTDPGAMPLPAE
jgi:hypothetical protein